MKNKHFIAIVCLSVLFVLFYLNRKYEVIACNPFYGEKECELKLITWNVHCSNGADYIRQKEIAELILKEDAYFVHLNEYNQDSCVLLDSLLRIKYPVVKGYQSHLKSGDIFFCKEPIYKTGRIYMPKQGEFIQPITTTILVGDDSVRVFGVHMASNHYDDSTIEKEFVSDSTSYDKYINAQENRCFQAHWTKNAVLESVHPVIVMGDMNDFGCSAPLDTLSTSGLKNAWWEGGNGYGATFHDGWMRLRIDHILYSEKLKLCGIKVIDTNLSDHNPVVAKFSVNN